MIDFNLNLPSGLKLTVTSLDDGAGGASVGDRAYAKEHVGDHLYEVEAGVVLARAYKQDHKEAKLAGLRALRAVLLNDLRQIDGLIAEAGH